MNLNEATQLVIQRAGLLLFQGASFAREGAAFFFLYRNLVNEYWLQLLGYQEDLFQQIRSWREDTQKVGVNILVVFCVLVCLALLSVLGFYLRIAGAQKEVLVKFLDIPTQRIRVLIHQLEQFLSVLTGTRDSEDDFDYDNGGSSSELDFLLHDQDDRQSEGHHHQKRGRRRKKFQINLGGNQKVFLPFLVISLACLAYIVAGFAISKSQIEHLDHLSSEFRLVSLAESQISFDINALRQSLFETPDRPPFTVLGDRQIYTYVEGVPEQIEALLDDISDRGQQNANIKGEELIRVQNQIFLSNSTCELLVLLASECRKYEDSTISNGLSLALSQLVYNYRKTLTQLTQPSPNLTEVLSSEVFQQLD